MKEMIVTNVEVGDWINTYGQKAQVIEIKGNICYLDTPVVVPTMIYTRDYVYMNEITHVY